MDIYLLNWGPVTPEGYNEDKNTALHVFNFFLKDEYSRSLATKFILGKIKWYKNHLTEDCFQIIRIDVRGQQIDFEILISFKAMLRNEISLNVDGLKFEVEILTN